MPQRICKDCGGKFPSSKGMNERGKKRCPPCAKEHRRAYIRNYYKTYRRNRK